MSKRGGGAVAKLSEKRKRMGTNHALGTIRALMTRPPAKSSTYADKRNVYEQHARAIMDGYNPGAAETFRGDGLPDDSLDAVKPPKTNAERAKEDKRPPIKAEAREGWRPQPYKTKWMLARGL